jgi:hypothetical protein
MTITLPMPERPMGSRQGTDPHGVLSLEEYVDGGAGRARPRCVSRRPKCRATLPPSTHAYVVMNLPSVSRGENDEQL